MKKSLTKKARKVIEAGLEELPAMTDKKKLYAHAGRKGGIYD